MKLTTFLHPMKIISFVVMITGTLLTLTSVNWLWMWLGLEINLIGFLPLLISHGSLYEKESGVTYFIVQALGSILFLVGCTISFSSSFSWDIMTTKLDCLIDMSSDSFNWGVYIIVLSLLLKLGVFPFHAWFPRVMAGSSWWTCLLLTTWQKLGPIYLLMMIVNMYMNNFIMLFLVICMSFSSLIGGYGGLNQTQTRAILAYSSINHMGWMIFCMLISKSLLNLYFFIYVLISLGIFIILWWCDMSSLKMVNNFDGDDAYYKRIYIISLLLSLGGFPPTLGFFSKFMVIWYSCVISSYSPALLIFLVMGSLITLYYYLTLMYATIFWGSSTNNWRDMLMFKGVYTFKYDKYIHYHPRMYIRKNVSKTHFWHSDHLMRQSELFLGKTVELIVFLNLFLPLFGMMGLMLIDFSFINEYYFCKSLDTPLDGFKCPEDDFPIFEMVAIHCY